MAPLPGFSFPSGSSKRPSTGTPKAPPSSSARFNPDTDILQLESASSSKGKSASLSQQSTLKALPSHGSTDTMTQLAPYPTPPSNKRLSPGSETDLSTSVVALPNPSSSKKPRISSSQNEGAERGAPSFSPVASGSQSTRTSNSPLKQLCVPVVRADGRTVFDLLSSDEENHDDDDDEHEDENGNDKNDATLVVSPSTAGQVSIRRSTSSSAHSPISLGPPSQEPEEIEAAPVSTLTGKKLSLKAQGKQRAVDPEPRPKKPSVAKKTTSSSSAPRRRPPSSDSDSDMDVDPSPVVGAKRRAPPTSPRFLGARKLTGSSHHPTSSSLNRPSLPQVPPPPSLPVEISQPDLADQLFSDSDKTSDDGNDNDPYLTLISCVPTPVGTPIPSTKKAELSHNLASEEIRSTFADGQRHRGPRTVERFEAMMRQSRENEGHRPCEIRVVNGIDPESDPTPSFEVTYIDRYIYGDNVPRARFPTGCGCKGSCNPRSSTCLCLREQRRYLPEGEEGFAYDDQGLKRFEGYPAGECSEACGCDETCINRVAQRGTDADLAIVKTEKKGWGVEARSRIVKNQYLSIYAGR